MNAVADLGSRIRDILRHQAAIDRAPCVAGIVCAERAGCGNGNKHPLRITWVEKDRVQAQPTGSGLPLRPCAMPAQARQLLPALAIIGRAEQRSIFNTGEYRSGVVWRGFEVPDSLELPWARRTVVPLVSSGVSDICKLIAHRFPCLAAIVRSLDQLSEPAAGLR